jgi:hypothetical protein
VPQPGTQGVSADTAFQGPRRRLHGTLLARWDAGDPAPWLLVTDLAPSAGATCGEGLQAGIEQGFKLPTRGGWQEPRTPLSDSPRAARLGLAVAVATLWLLRVGGLVKETIPVGTLLALPAPGGPDSRPRPAPHLHLVSVFRQGWMTILGALFNHHRLPLGRFVPEPWPRAAQDNTPSVPIEMLLAA